MIRILTDSASDILPAEAEQLGVTVIPLNVTLEDGVVLRDGIDMTPSAYYDHLASCRKLPTTSQPSPELFEKFYLEAAAAGDEVLGIFLSHELSGTWQCAKLAADLANVDNVLFVDSANVCLGEALLVRLAVQLRDAGKTLVQIAGRKPVKFCSSACRVSWWNAHPDAVGKKAFYDYTCACCGKTFRAYGNSHRKYCCHTCYIQARFKGGDAHD